mgnify:CR=1 FL=1
MYFDSFEAFIAMGGHGLYVWVSYAIALVVITLLFVQPLQRKRQFLNQQQMLLRRTQREENR